MPACTGTLSGTLLGPVSDQDPAAEPSAAPYDAAPNLDEDAGSPWIGPAEGDAGTTHPAPDDAGTPDAGTPDAGPADPCAALACGANAHCVVDACACDDGFELQGGSCVSSPVGDPASHAQADVCARYNESRAVSSGYFIAGASTCDPGTLTRDGIDDALQRLNFYRWLTGLGPVTADDPDDNAQAQLCSVTSAWNPAGLMAHHPDPSAVCYTEGGAIGAAHSNIAWGPANPSAMIDQFIVDNGNETTLGHRRWCLYAPLGGVGVGFYRGGGSGFGYYGGAACLKVIGTRGASSSPRPDVVAFPPAGFVPVQVIQGMWSISAGGLGGNIDVTITRMSDGMDLATTVHSLIDGYGAPTTAWTLDGWSPAAGEDYRVVVTDGTSTVTYHVMPVRC